MKTLTVATRGGKLAIAQTEIVIDSLKKIYPGLQIEIKKVTTAGDRDKRTALWNLKETGFFTSQLEDTLLARQADFAVHSLKDLPTSLRDGLTIAAVCDRQYAEDCSIAAKPVAAIEELPHTAKIGTSSLRRIAQLKRLRADLKLEPIRGNVTTRIKKLEEACPRAGGGQFDAIILARAGVERLGLSARISFCFDPRQFIPAPAQGALAVQTRTDDIETTELISAIDDKIARLTAFAERQVLVTLQCGCHAPVGVFAEIVGDKIKIYAFISDLEGKSFVSRSITGPISDVFKLTDELANDLLSAGGQEILRDI
ncbi:MAG: hydroxymethylbilane synthase [Planctomycetes bacterium RBG_13_44_8b]|nr:MAG: hydroxymethylbilane synthase [Planctomycetes bacterium RBG_13_44_8b]